MIDVLNYSNNGKIEYNKTIHDLLREMELLESLIIQKSDTINVVTTSMDAYHSAIYSHINEVFYSLDYIIKHLKIIHLLNVFMKS